MRVLVCGSRFWEDQQPVDGVLDGLYAWHGSGLMVIEGGARGADRCAARWAQERDDVAHRQFRADWENLGRGAGPARNRRMLEEGLPELVVAFKDGFGFGGEGGTEHMVRIAKQAGVPVWVVSHG